MFTKIKSTSLFYIFTLLMCFNVFILKDTAAQVTTEQISTTDSDYTFETINVEGVDYLALTASNDFGDYAGYTKSSDGSKTVAWTLIDDVFTKYDFTGSLNTLFFALANDGTAAGYYEDTNGLHQGIVLKDGELQEYKFPNAVQTEIYGISDTTHVLTGNFIDDSGVRRGFSGEMIVEVPDASATFANFATSSGAIVGSYIDSDGIYHGYVRAPDGRFIFADVLDVSNLEYFFAHGVNNVGIAVIRAKAVDDIPRTYVGNFAQIRELRVPDSVTTEGWNIYQDGSVIGHYDSSDGRRHGFIAKPKGDDTTPMVEDKPVVNLDSFTYTYETINVPGVDFLAVTASSDFEGYAGYTKSNDAEKDVAFTLIDGVFTPYDFPGSKNTYFFALGNNGNAAGYYEDSNGLHHGVVLQDGELQEYDFPGAVQTEIYGISDATGVLTGNFIDAEGIRRGFSGETIVEVPEASATFADFVSGSGTIVGSYIDSDGQFHAYGRAPDGKLAFADVLTMQNMTYVFTHGINDVGIIVVRAKAADDVPRTYVGRFGQLHELNFPGSVSTEGYNINQDGSIVGHYESLDGRRHGFIARPAPEAESTHFGNAYNVTLTKGLNMISLPLAPTTPMTAKSLAGIAGSTMVIALDPENQHFVGWTPDAPNDGFLIEGGQGYIVNVLKTRNFAFVGAPWTDQTEDAAAPAAISTDIWQEAWAFVVSGHLKGKPTFNNYQVIVRNLRTNSTITAAVHGDYFAAANADLTRRNVVKVGDVIELRVIGPGGNVESQTLSFKVTPEDLANAVLSVNLDSIGKPTQNQLLQNYPNPFNPETWIPYQLSQDSPVSIYIYDMTGKLVRTLSLGFQTEGFYNSRARAAHWDGKNAQGEPVASGVYFYTLKAGDFSTTRKMLIRK